MYVVFFVFAGVQQVSSVPSNISPLQGHFSTASVCIPKYKKGTAVSFLYLGILCTAAWADVAQACPVMD